MTQIPIYTRHWRRLCCFVYTSLFAATFLQAQCALSCNQGLQVSLDNSGQALITPLMIAPNAGSSCPGNLTVTLYNQVGQVLPNPITCSQIGQTVTARVKHTASGNSCNGTLEVFDALPPVLSNCTDKFVFCHEDVSPASIGFPVTTDNCTPSGELNIHYLDIETSLSCGIMQSGIPVLKRIDRHWTVSDGHGNSNTCVQRIWLKHITLADITFPPNLDNLSSPALACGQDPEDLALTGQPTANGVPVDASPECEMGVTYSDQVIQHCAPGGYTVLRNWTAIDFCSGAFSNRIQIIRVEDQQPPVLTAPDPFQVGTDGFLCSGTVIIPPATATDNCSAVTVTPSWAFGSGYGPFHGIPEGEHIITYYAEDACGNQATATTTVTVLDQSPPQAICSSGLQVALSANGLGYIQAATIDAGSFDNCSPDFLKPTLACPPHLTLNCLQDYNDLSLTGQATGADNCSLQNIVYQDILNIQPCNTGSMTRWWTATDAAGNSKSCNQFISVEVVNGATVVFPQNVVLSACAQPGDLLPAATGQPVIGGSWCSPLSVNYTDQVFNAPAPSCYRIFRQWKVVDHCVYNPNGGSAGVWEHTEALDCSSIQLLQHNSLFSTNPLNASGNYPVGEHLITFSAADACGNQAQQILRITVMPALIPDQAWEIGGALRNEGGMPVRHVPVMLFADGYYAETTADSNGVFRFEDVPDSLGYTLQPYNNANMRNGVTTFDLVLKSKHILGLEPLNSPYKMLAADANRSGSITTFDILQLRKLILGNSDSLSGNQSWRFVRAGYIFPDSLNPFNQPVPEQIQLPILQQHQFGQNFIGFKTGDVNGSSNPAEARTLYDTLFVQVAGREFRAGEVIDIPLALSGWSEMEGFQFALQVDTQGFEVMGPVFEHPEWINASHVNGMENSLWRFSWNQPYLTKTPPNDNLLHLRLRAKSDGKLADGLTLNVEDMPAEAYAAFGQYALGLRFHSKEGDQAARLLNVYPNPCQGTFYISNPYPDRESTCRVLNQLGQVVWEQTGMHPESIQVQLPDAGSQMYQVEFRAGTEVMAGKVMVQAP